MSVIFFVYNEIEKRYEFEGNNISMNLIFENFAKENGIDLNNVNFYYNERKINGALIYNEFLKH